MGDSGSLLSPLLTLPSISGGGVGGWESPCRGQKRMNQRMLKFKKAHEFGGITDESFN